MPLRLKQPVAEILEFTGDSLYAMTAGIAIVAYFVLWRMAVLSTATQLALWIPFVVLFPLWFFRYSRSLWLALEYVVNPEQ